MTSDLGALPQTTAGFARLVPPVRTTYEKNFVDAMVETLREAARGTDADLLRRQVVRVNETCTWRRRASEWAPWLQSLRDGASGERRIPAAGAV